ncbi:MAG: hypothetical protein ACOYN4_09835 [Bacteroidales bacterium]
MYRFSICLSDLPKEKMKKANNGKIYINLVAGEKREPDQYGQDVYVAVDHSKEERDANTKRIYVGGGWAVKPTAAVSPDAVSDMPAAEPGKDDLPF